MAESQRTLKRIQLIAALDVLHPATERLIGVVTDISPEGLGARSRQEFQSGHQYDLRVLLPAEILGQNHFDVTARCAWCRPSNNPALFDAGFQFVDATPDTIEIVEQLIRRYRR